MKRRYVGILCIALLACLLCMDGMGVQAGRKKMSVKWISGKRTVTIGKKLTLKAKILHKKKGAKLVWSSSRKSIASVNKKGIIQGRKAGKAKITVRIKGTKIKRTCTVVVKREARKVSSQTKMPSPAKPSVPAKTPERIPAGTQPSGNTEPPGQTLPATGNATQTSIPPTNSPGETTAPTYVPHCSELIPYSAVMMIDGEIMTVFLVNKNYDGQVHIRFNGKEFAYSGNARDVLMLLANGGMTKESGDGMIRVSRATLEDGTLEEYWNIEDRESGQAYQVKATTKNTVNSAITNCGVLYFKGDVTSVISVY